MHVTGQQLGQLTGIAAILRFPLPEIEEEDDNSDEVMLLALTVLIRYEHYLTTQFLRTDGCSFPEN